MRVIEAFRSIQGEGTRTGEPCAFVRLAGCNLRCAWCDTPHALEDGTETDVDALVARVAAMRTRLVCVTGGEPLLQPDTPALVARLLDAGHDVQVMTNGSLPLSALDPRAARVVDVKSPWSGDEAVPAGHPLPPLPPAGLDPANLDALGPRDEVKFVARDRAEFDWFVAWADRVGLYGRAGTVLVGPAWGIVAPGTLADWILDSGRPIRLNLQVHKLIWGAQTRR
jgi:7-carboxy-7-deazaguanine synthase